MGGDGGGSAWGEPEKGRPTARGDGVPPVPARPERPRSPQETRAPDSGPGDDRPGAALPSWAAKDALDRARAGDRAGARDDRGLTSFRTDAARLGRAVELEKRIDGDYAAIATTCARVLTPEQWRTVDVAYRTIKDSVWGRERPAAADLQRLSEFASAIHAVRGEYEARDAGLRGETPTREVPRVADTRMEPGRGVRRDRPDRVDPDREILDATRSNPLFALWGVSLMVLGREPTRDQQLAAARSLSGAWGLMTVVAQARADRSAIRDMTAPPTSQRAESAFVHESRTSSRERSGPTVLGRSAVLEPRRRDAISGDASSSRGTEVVTPATDAAAAGPKPSTPDVPAWRPEWEPLIAKVELPTPRVNDRGFRVQDAQSSDRRTQVVITEGIVGAPSTGRSTADYGTILPGEHSTHPVGRQLGEDVGPSAQGSAPARFNLSEMKAFENDLAAAARVAAEHGGTVETRTVMVTELRTVRGHEVPVVVGVRRTADVRLPGRDPVFLMEMEAVIDPHTRAATVTHWKPRR